MRLAIRSTAIPALALLAAAIVPALAGASSNNSVTVSGTGIAPAGDSSPVSAAVGNGASDPGGAWSWTGAAYANGLDGSGARAAAGGTTALYGCAGQVCVVSQANTSTSDTVHIPATALATTGTPVNVTVTMTLDGSINGNGGWHVNAAGGIGVVQIYDGTTSGLEGTYAQSVHQVATQNLTLLVGSSYPLDTSLLVNVYLRGTAPLPFGITADFMNGLTIQATVTTSDLGPLQLLGDSGRDYLLPPVPYVDTDGDVRADNLDNCTLVANADQRDTNGDGYGNLCDPDFNNDGVVNINDFNRLKARLGITPVVDVDTDLDGNGAVNINDLNRLKSFLGKPPGPSGLHPNCPPTCP